MSIKSEAYNLYKLVQQSPNRDKIKALINNLNKVPKNAHGTESDRSNFGYLARQYYKQFLGYLIIDEDRENILKKDLPIPLPPLQSDERQTLQNLHRELLLLNENCLAPLKNDFPDIFNAINPYSEYQIQIPTGNSDTDTILLSATEITAFSAIFQQHPAFKNLMDTIGIASQITPEKYHKHIVTIVTNLQNPNDKDISTTLSKVEFGKEKNSPERILFRHFFASACLRNSLAVLNQLLFQASFKDKPVLSANNIIELRFLQGGYTEKIELLYQSDEKISVEDPQTLVFVNYSIGDTNIRDLYQIEQILYEYNQDFGETITASLAKIDDNLTSFSEILRI